MTIDQHVAAVRQDRKTGMDALVSALQSDPEFAMQAQKRLMDINGLERANRHNACWISKLTKETLTEAFTVARGQPGVPAGG